MSHYTVLVIGDYPESQLEPFDENLEVERYCVGAVSDEDKEEMLSYYKGKGFDFESFDECYKAKGEEWNCNQYVFEDGEWRVYSTYNPNSKWDWYVLGGRWSGKFIKLKNDRSGTIGQSGAFGNDCGIDQAVKGDIDFDAIKKEARTNAKKLYREVEEKCGGSIPRMLETWNEVLSSPAYANLDIKAKRELYHSQSALKVWNEKVNNGNSWGYDLEDFQCSEIEYILKRELKSFIPYAVLYEGEWISRGDMGWFGVTTTTHYDETEWEKNVWKIVEECPDDTLFSFYDLHI